MASSGYENEIAKYMKELDDRIRRSMDFKDLRILVFLLRPLSMLLELEISDDDKYVLLARQKRVFDAVNENITHHWLGAMNRCQLSYASYEIEAIGLALSSSVYHPGDSIERIFFERLDRVNGSARRTISSAQKFDDALRNALMTVGVTLDVCWSQKNSKNYGDSCKEILKIGLDCFSSFADANLNSLLRESPASFSLVLKSLHLYGESYYDDLVNRMRNLLHAELARISGKATLGEMAWICCNLASWKKDFDQARDLFIEKLEKKAKVALNEVQYPLMVFTEALRQSSGGTTRLGLDSLFPAAKMDVENILKGLFPKLFALPSGSIPAKQDIEDIKKLKDAGIRRGLYRVASESPAIPSHERTRLLLEANKSHGEWEVADFIIQEFVGWRNLAVAIPVKSASDSMNVSTMTQLTRPIREIRGKYVLVVLIAGKRIPGTLLKQIMLHNATHPNYIYPIDSQALALLFKSYGVI